MWLKLRICPRAVEHAHLKAFLAPEGESFKKLICKSSNARVIAGGGGGVRGGLGVWSCSAHKHSDYIYLSEVLHNLSISKISDLNIQLRQHP